jgi:UDP-N-acetylglucosamine-lysosomal-enzyme
VSSLFYRFSLLLCRISLIPSFRYEILGTDEVAFLMVNENYAKTQKSLDGIRERRQKFICLNDNMNHTNPDSQKTVAVLREFYESIFAVPSTFELPADSPNSILYIDELRAE